MANKQRHYDCRANSKGAVNTASLLVMFLLSIAAFVLGSLYFELRYKNQLLQDEVAELKESQILFMVPDEQAEVMANWMAENPVFVQSFVARARAGELTSMPIGDGSVEQLIQSSTTQANQAEAENGVAADKNIINTEVGQLAIDSAESTVPLVDNRLLRQDDSSSVEPVQATALQKDSSVTEHVPNEIVPETIYSFPDQAQMLNITEEGVKLISLPHGGIRITTRALEE
ncbi:Conserved hypothetical protein [Shewanella piezotolerans WP3]|uniref:Membrane anchored protein in chemotaxis locus n=1 Tax=Shewanella piezotolerans (strain WP3 / JCM 13877) TaxID=225849 RepID=B8CL01_SHEPW|nr:hypothetical protein [Shewanella piezotolerans]ACJ28327.1 Conserved hypothetical protein [Shewanella piezotolerans WP3]